MKVFLQDTLSNEQQQAIAKEVQSHAKIAQSQFVDRAAAQQEFMIKHPDFAPLIEDLGTNPFQAFFSLKLNEKTPQTSKAVADQLSKLPGVESVDYGGSWLERYVAIKGGLKLISYLLAAMIILACIFLISNTIRLNIFTRHDEIDIFKLVGGTKIFIAIPFILEGILLSLFGATLAIATLYILFQFSLSGAAPEMSYLTGNLKLVFLNRQGVMLVYGVAFGTGLIGSVISLRRFLRYQ